MRRDSLCVKVFAFVLVVAACGSSAPLKALGIAEWCALANSRNQALDATPVSDQRRVADYYVVKWDALASRSYAVPTQLTDLAERLANGYRQIANRVRSGEAFAEIATDPNGPLNDDLFKAAAEFDDAMKGSCPAQK